MLLVALVAALLMAAVAVGLLLLTNTERAIAGNFQAAHQGRLAADAALERAFVDVRNAGPGALLAGAVLSGFRDVSMTPMAPWGARIDLLAVTTEIQRQSDAALAWSPNRPRWRLLIAGSLSDLTSPAGASSPWYLAAWIGDDLEEHDGDLFTDTNGTVLITAAALGPSGRRHVNRAAVSGDGGLRLLWWNEVR